MAEASPPASPSSTFSFRRLKRRSADAASLQPASPAVSTLRSSNTASDNHQNASKSTSNAPNTHIAAKVAPGLAHKPASSSKMFTSAGAELDLDDDNVFRQAEMAVTQPSSLEEKRRESTSLSSPTSPSASETISDKHLPSKSDVVNINGNVEQFHRMATRQVFITLAVVAVIVFVLVHLSIVWPVIALIIGIIILFLHNSLHALKEDFAYTVEHQLLKSYTDKLDGESVGWVNNIIDTMWTEINPDIFVPIVDLLEDTMQYIAPSAIVQSVRIEGFSLGVNPFRILSIRTYPPSQLFSQSSSNTGGNVFDMEVAFSYRRAAPTVGKKNNQSQSNVHFLVYLGAGIGKLVGMTIPCYVELRGVVGKLNLRVETSPDLPFLRNATFSFPSKPTIHVVAKPLSTLDVMNLPLISNYVLSSINTVLSYFVEPKSYTIDLTRMLLGSNMIYKTHNVGMIYIFIGRGFDLLVSDVSGKSDPYVTVSFARFEKPLYCTRIIKRDLNPFWMESSFIKIAPEHITDDEKVRLTVLDSDRYSADDIIGIVEQSVKELVSSPGKMFLRRDKLQARYRGTETKGNLSWAVGYFPLTSPLYKDSSSSSPSSNDIKEEDSSPSSGKTEKKKNDIPFFLKETKILHEPPRGDASSAILAFQIHQLDGLEIPATHRKGKRNANDEEETTIPSSFCMCFLSDEKVFKTRTKACSGSPYINAGSEVFVKDWKNATFSLAVLDSRMREHNAVIGTVNIKLADIFKDRSELTTWYPLLNGIGYGNVRLSLLLRTVDIKLPRELNGPNIGVLEIHEIKLNTISASRQSEDWSVNISCGSGVSKSAERFSRVQDEKIEDGLQEWAWISSEDLQEQEKHVPPKNKPICIPIVKKYQHPVRFELKDSGSSKISRKVWVGEASAWLATLIDNEETTIKLPIQSAHWRSRRQNCCDVPAFFPCSIQDPAATNPDREIILGSDKSSKRYSSASEGGIESSILEVKVKFVPGISWLHRGISTHHGRAIRDAYKVFEWRHVITTAAEKHGAKASLNIVPPPPKIVTQDDDDINPDELNEDVGFSPPGTANSMDWVTEKESPMMNNNKPLNSPRPTSHTSASKKPDELFSNDHGTNDYYSDNEKGGSRINRYLNKKKQQSLIKSKLHRGMYQIKTVRTLSWAKDTTKSGIRRAAHTVSHKGRDPKTEKEVFSSF